MLPQDKRHDALVLLLLLVVSVIYAVLFRGTILGKPLIVGIVLFITPTIYLGYRKKKHWKKIFVGTIIFGLLYGFCLDYVAEFTKAWTVTDSIFPFRLLNVNTLDSVLGIAMMTLLTFTFYEHFLDVERRKKINHRVWYAAIIGVVLNIMVITVSKLLPGLLNLHHPYLFIGIAAISPLLVTVLLRPQFYTKFASMTFYFFIMYFVFEYIAVAFNYWVFNGSYVGVMRIQSVTFPLEEMIFWMILYASTLVCYYEIAIDDGH